jgi:hypothetical protein
MTQTAEMLATLPATDHRVTLADAAAYTRRYREAGSSEVVAGALDAEQVRALLRQPGCAALRMYYGLTEGGDPTLVLVGVRADGADMTDGIMLQNLFPCPPFCAPPSDLNG